MTPILQTKLYVPSPRPELVPRPRLIERLNSGIWQNNGFARKLTLISAPAGFGKTMLLCEWLAGFVNSPALLDNEPESHQRPQVAWYSLDENDNDVTRFLVYLVTALQGVTGGFPKSILGSLHSPPPPPIEGVLTALINEIAGLSEQIIFVLDDYHLIEAQSIHEALTFLLQNLPSQLHLVIATREDPPLPLSRLRVRGQLTELRVTDLRFTSSEVAQFLNDVMDLTLSAEDIANLEARTEGWIAGLQLAALSMRDRDDASGFVQSFTGSHHFVLDYLVEEALERQPQDVQSFLLHTAVLARLTGPLCDAVWLGVDESPGSSEETLDDGQQILEYLERANLFLVPLDNERRWYRYHHLFADLLRQRLSQAQPDLVPELHIRASVWYEQNDLTDEAIAHALHAEDFQRALRLIDTVAEGVWLRGEDTKLRRWLAALPEGMITGNPHLGILRAWSLFTSGQLDAAQQSLLNAEQALSTSPDTANQSQTPGATAPPDPAKLHGRVAALHAFIASYQRDVPGIIRNAHQALQALPAEDVTWRSITAMVLGDAHAIKGDMKAAYQARLAGVEACEAAGDVYFAIMAKLKLVVTLRDQGQLQQTLELCQQQWQLMNNLGYAQTRAGGWALAIWGDVLAERNKLDEALKLTTKAVAVTERAGDRAMLSWSYMCLLRVLFSRGELDDAEALIRKVTQVTRTTHLPPWVANRMATWQARIWLTQNKLPAVLRWADERGFSSSMNIDSLRDINYFMLPDYIMLARFWIAQGRLDSAIRLLQRLLESADAGGRMTRVMEIRILTALALQTRDELPQAMEALKLALDLGESQGFIRIFVNEGTQMARLLYLCLSQGLSPDYVQRLLAEFPETEQEHTPPSETENPNRELVEPLSERELEVLQHIAEGSTNPEIAAKLFLSLHTVKVHAHNIYGKLGVRNRIEAVSKAKTLGILPSTIDS